MILYEDELADNGVSLLTVKVVSWIFIENGQIDNYSCSESLADNVISIIIAESDAELLVSSTSFLGEFTRCLSKECRLFFLFNLV